MEFLGNTGDLIDWQSVIEDISSKSPEYIGPRHTEHDKIKDIELISNAWKKAGLKLGRDGGSIEWDMFTNHQYGNDVTKLFEDFVGADDVASWISRIRPGFQAPWHWDTTDFEDEYDSIPNLIRVSCFISEPTDGHIFILENKCFYREKRGNVYKWPSRKSWHAGANSGFTPKYMYNFIGKLR